MITKLTDKEKKVLLNLVRYPELNDMELSDKIDIKRSTITAIRNRLKKEKFFTTVAIPNFPKLGCKLLGVLYGKFNPQTPRSIRKSAETFQEKIVHPELIYARSTDTEVMAIYMAKTLADIRKVQDKFILDYEAHHFLEEINQVFYPLELCDIPVFFDYSRLLSKLFNIPLDEKIPIRRNIWDNFDPINLTKTEKIIMHAIVKYPDKSSIEIAKITGKTRSTVSKVKKKLIETKMIKIKNIPALSKLESELMLFFHIKFRPNAIREKRLDGTELLMKEFTPILKVSGDIESVGITVPKNYTEYKDTYNTIISYYKEKRYIRDNPRILLFPIDKIKLRKMDFVPLLEKMLFGN